MLVCSVFTVLFLILSSSSHRVAFTSQRYATTNRNNWCISTLKANSQRDCMIRLKCNDDDDDDGDEDEKEYK